MQEGQERSLKDLMLKYAKPLPPTKVEFAAALLELIARDADRFELAAERMIITRAANEC